MLRLKSEASGKDSDNLLYAMEIGTGLSQTFHRVQHEKGHLLLGMVQLL
jgi:hypothetical protein